MIIFTFLINCVVSKKSVKFIKQTKIFLLTFKRLYIMVFILSDSLPILILCLKRNRFVLILFPYSIHMVSFMIFAYSFSSIIMLDAEEILKFTSRSVWSEYCRIPSFVFTCQFVIWKSIPKNDEIQMTFFFLYS